MTAATLTLHGMRLDADALANPPATLARSENDAAALDFCRAWLAGAPSFSVQTSGSTGAPKPIALTRAQMEASARATAAALGLRAGMASLVCLPTRYIAGRMMLVRGLVLGLAMTLAEPTADPLAALPRHAHFDFAAFIPLQIESLLAGAQRARVDAMRAVLVGGGPVSAVLAQVIAPLSAPVFHTYGMTETATHIALRRLSGPQRSDLFHPLPGVETRLDDRGCLAIRGPMTNQLWVQTNDLVTLQAHGAFVWLGRADNVINTGGVKVAIEPLEAALEALLPDLLDAADALRRFAVVGLPDARLGQQVALVLEGDPLPSAAASALLTGLRAVLGPFETPRRLLCTPRLPLTPTGKIDRAALAAQLA